MNTQFITERDFDEFSCIQLSEPEINHEATEYFAENYRYIMNQAKKMNGVDPSKVEDLVQDVFMSLLKAENNGEGYSTEHLNKEGTSFTVKEFVFGRLKQYSKNRKYTQNYSYQHKNKSGETVYDEVSASCSDERDLDSMDADQKAYALASAPDEISSMEDLLSIKSDIQLCCDFNEVFGFDFMNLFRNIDIFKSTEFDSQIFSDLGEKLRYHDEVGSAFYSVLEYSMTYPQIFQDILEKI